MSELERDTSAIEGQHLAGDPRELLEAILEVLTVESGYELRRSKAPAMRANGNVEKILADVSTVTLLKANGARRGAAIYNDSAATLYVKLAGKADLDSWTVKLGAGDYYEPPAGYRGGITGVWSAAAGQARVTEFE